MSTTSSALTILLTLFCATGCKSVIDRQDVRPKVLKANARKLLGM